MESSCVQAYLKCLWMCLLLPGCFPRGLRHSLPVECWGTSAPHQSWLDLSLPSVVLQYFQSVLHSLFSCWHRSTMSPRALLFHVLPKQKAASLCYCTKTIRIPDELPATRHEVWPPRAVTDIISCITAVCFISFGDRCCRYPDGLEFRLQR